MSTSALEPNSDADPSGVSGAHAADIALAQQLIQGEPAAVEAFCKDYTDRVRLYVSARLADGSSAEHDDLTQIIIIAAIKNVKNYRGNSSLLTWLLGIARNKVADAFEDHVKRRQVEISMSDMVDSDGNELDLPDHLPENEPETVALLNDLRGHIRVALNTLRAEYQEVLLLRYVEDLSVAEVAEVLGLSKRKVEYRLTEARAAFRQALVRLGMNPSSK
ncbi:MAG: RNA polymerase sigma factor [Chloroflexi bacterium]|nr:RNA polymerase sigma factor [Chloroflexota bacterium]